MTLSVNSNGDVPQQPAIYGNSYIPDQLIGGGFPLVTQNVTIKSGTTVNGLTVLPRGTVLGQITTGTATSVAGTNTGTGTFVLDATTPVQINAKVGAYKLTILATGRAQLLDPLGRDLGEYDFSSGGTVTINSDIKGVLTDTSTHFVAGDIFTITVAAGSGKYIPSVATAVDGSQIPLAILVDDCNPASADQNAGVYLSGEFNQSAITYDSSWTVTTMFNYLRSVSIFLKAVLTASDPS
jgi:hypothetical protein